MMAITMAGLQTRYITAVLSLMHLALVSGSGPKSCRSEQARFRIILLSVQ